MLGCLRTVPLEELLLPSLPRQRTDAGTRAEAHVKVARLGCGPWRRLQALPLGLSPLLQGVEEKGTGRRQGTVSGVIIATLWGSCFCHTRASAQDGSSQGLRLLMGEGEGVSMSAGYSSCPQSQLLRRLGQEDFASAQEFGASLDNIMKPDNPQTKKQTN